MLYEDAMRLAREARAGKAADGMFPPISDEVAMVLCEDWATFASDGAALLGVADLVSAYIREAQDSSARAFRVVHALNEAMGDAGLVPDSDPWVAYWAIVRWAGSCIPWPRH